MLQKIEVIRLKKRVINADFYYRKSFIIQKIVSTGTNQFTTK